MQIRFFLDLKSKLTKKDNQHQRDGDSGYTSMEQHRRDDEKKSEINK